MNLLRGPFLFVCDTFGHCFEIVSSPKYWFFFRQTMAQNLTIRLARSTDYDQILKLSKGIYDGHDYLPPRYHTWMAIENLHVMLAFSGNKLASLVACSIIDEGKTVVTRAGRTSQEFRGQGIYKLLQRAILDFSLRLYPIIQKWRLVTVFSPEMLWKRRRTRFFDLHGLKFHKTTSVIQFQPGFVGNSTMHEGVRLRCDIRKRSRGIVPEQSDPGGSISNRAFSIKY